MDKRTKYIMEQCSVLSKKKRKKDKNHKNFIQDYVEYISFEA